MPPIAIQFHSGRVIESHPPQISRSQTIHSIFRNTDFHPTPLRQHRIRGISFRSRLSRRNRQCPRKCFRTTDDIHFETRQLIIFPSTPYDGDKSHIQNTPLPAYRHLTINVRILRQVLSPYSHTLCFRCGQTDIFRIIQTDFVAETTVILVQRNHFRILDRQRIRTQYIPIHISKFLCPQTCHARQKQKYGRL